MTASHGFNKSELDALEKDYAAALASLAEIDRTIYPPRYPQAVNLLMERLCREPWVDRNYRPDAIAQIRLKIAEASFDEIRSLLTATSRSERFCDGAWLAVLTKDELAPAIRRLGELVEGNESVDTSPPR